MTEFATILDDFATINGKWFLCYEIAHSHSLPKNCRSARIPIGIHSSGSSIEAAVKPFLDAHACDPHGFLVIHYDESGVRTNYRIGYDGKLREDTEEMW